MTRDDELDDATLREAAQRLGQRAAERLDLERTAQAVLTRLKTEPVVVRPFWSSPLVLRIAAVLVLLLGGFGVRQMLRPSVSTDVAVVVPPTSDAGLEGLSTDQLQALLPTVDQTGDVTDTPADDAGLEALNTDDLRTLLGSLAEGG
jgi:hypothetical protein